jgi:hypothetical protein
MGPYAKVGHDKLLIGLARVAPSTGTIEGIGEAPPTLLMTKLHHELSKWRLVGERNESAPA